MNIREKALNFLDTSMKGKSLDDMPISWEMLMSARNQLISLDDTLLSEVEWLQRTLAGTNEELRKDEHVNSLGIIQSKGMAIDRLCILRDAKRVEVSNLLELCESE